MKSMMMLVAMSFFSASVFAAATVSDVKARQRYPWNGLVDIDYTITGDASNLAAEIKVEDRQNGMIYAPTKFLSAVPTSEGRHRVTWSTEAEGVTIVSTNVAVTISLVTTDPSVQRNSLYYVVDLSGGPTATRYPVTTMTVSDGKTWSDEYKTTKLVLRRIDPGQDPCGRYTIDSAYYIGVFEVTVAQWNLVMATSTNLDVTDKRAKGSVSYNMIRGSNLGSGYPNSTDVDGESFLGNLRSRTGIRFDLPTENQWVYACRAGTTSEYNNGGNSEADLATLGRYSGNRNDGRGGYSGVTTVGSYAPNAWGLYDMHGNLDEWCLEAFSTSFRVMRGGCYNSGAGNCSSSSRNSGYPSSHYDYSGFRLACSAGL